MTRRDRVQAAFHGEPVDRMPVSFWQHFPGHDEEPVALARATVEYQLRFDLDFVKLMPTGMYPVMDYGVAVVPSGDAIGTTRYASGPIQTPADWDRLPALSPDRGVLGREVDVVRRVRAALPPDVAVIQTIFSPLTVAAKLTGGGLGQVPGGQEPVLERVLPRLAGDVIAFGRACLAVGADGFFFATQFAGARALPEGAYERVGVSYDLRVLEALRPGSWALILHLHGDDPLFELADRYPVDAVNWHARETVPSLRDALRLTRRALAGGIARMGPVLTGPVDAVRDEVRDAIAGTGGCRLIVAPGCVIPTTAPADHLVALRRAVEP